MNIRGLDRVGFMVRDIEKAVSFFSKKFGMEFLELSPDMVQEEGVRCFIDHDNHLELVSPVFPLSENCPPAVREKAELLKENEAILAEIIFKVDSMEEVKRQLNLWNIEIQHEYTKSRLYQSHGLENYEQVVIQSNETLGLIVGFTCYDRVVNEQSPWTNREARGEVPVKGFDRLVLMVRDMEKTLAFFSKMLGLKFLELEKNIAVRDGIESYLCQDANLHFISPILPLPDNAALPVKERADLLKDNEAVFLAVTFMVENLEETIAQLIRSGLTIQWKINKSDAYTSIDMKDFEEVVTSSERTLGILMGFASYEKGAK